MGRKDYQSFEVMSGGKILYEIFQTLLTTLFPLLSTILFAGGKSERVPVVQGAFSYEGIPRVILEGLIFRLLSMDMN